MKILILGNGGSGKSYLAKRLAALLTCEPIHLDNLYWNPGSWIHNSKDQWDTALLQYLQKETWVMEGTPMRDLSVRIAHADLIVLLDTARYICILRVIRKGIANIIRKNKPYNDGCPIRGLSLRAIKWVWNYPYKTRPIILSQLAAAQSSKNVLYLKNKQESALLIKNFSVYLS